VPDTEGLSDNAATLCPQLSDQQQQSTIAGLKSPKHTVKPLQVPLDTP